MTDNPTRNHHPDRPLEISLALIRITSAAFLLVWSIQKILRPEMAQGIFSKFYFSEISTGIALAFGVLQTLIILAFLAGLFKTWTYGAILGMHAVSTLSTVGQLINPYERPNALFWAAVPVLGALIGLFLLRDRDRFLTLGNS